MTDTEVDAVAYRVLRSMRLNGTRKQPIYSTDVEDFGSRLIAPALGAKNSTRSHSASCRGSPSTPCLLI